ncbi:MAG: class I SAM-dependent methyltransferase [Ignavibacteria bacterium]
MHENIREKSVNLEIRLKEKLYSRMPDYVFSNDLFESWIKESLKTSSIWIDAGCGKNELVHEFCHLAPGGTGIDEVIHPELLTSDDKFIRADLKNIPLADESVDTITANMVVEHITDIKAVLNEFSRILKKGGNFIFRTTNKWYPTLLLGHLFPKAVKDKIIYKVFGVNSHDIFKTSYPVNTLKDIRRTLPAYGYKIHRLLAVEDLHLFNPAVFEASYFFYKIQKRKLFQRLRNCIVCWAVKE